MSLLKEVIQLTLWVTGTYRTANMLDFTYCLFLVNQDKERLMHRLLLLVLTTVLFSGCAGMKFNAFGIDVKEMRDTARAGDYGKLALGVVASLGTHVAGHFIAAEVFDVDIHLDGLNEVVDYSKNPSEGDLRWMARGGFVLQLAVNTALVELWSDSYFTKGYTAFTSVELLTYGLRHPDDGDFNLIDESGGNGSFEYFLYSSWAAYNFCRVSISKEEQICTDD